MRRHKIVTLLARPKLYKLDLTVAEADHSQQSRSWHVHGNAGTPPAGWVGTPPTRKFVQRLIGGRLNAEVTLHSRGKHHVRRRATALTDHESNNTRGPARANDITTSANLQATGMGKASSFMSHCGSLISIYAVPSGSGVFFSRNKRGRFLFRCSRGDAYRGLFRHCVQTCGDTAGGKTSGALLSSVLWGFVPCVV